MLLYISQVSAFKFNPLPVLPIQSVTKWLCIVMCIFFITESDLWAEYQEVPNKNISIPLDIDTPPSGRNKLSDTLSLGAALTLENTNENNYDSDVRRRDDFNFLNTELEIAFTYVPSAYWDAYIDFELVDESEFLDEGNNHDHDTELNVKELNVTFRNLEPGIALKAGRQVFKDEREWLYDEELDALRMYYSNAGIGVEASVSSDRLFRRDLLNSDERINIYNYFLLGNYHFNENNGIAVYLFIRDDQEEDERPVWLGLRARGKNGDGTGFWFESACLKGRGESSNEGWHQDIDAYAIDIGGTYVFDLPFKPALTLGWAYGSGDEDPTANGDSNFRQTGLQDNNGRFNGVTRFKYYGEMLEPELSNLNISTIGLGMHPKKKTSIDLVFHTYQQVVNANYLRDSNLEMDPTGSSNVIGKGMDLIIGYRAINDLSVEFVFGQFIPGDAFSKNADKSTLLNLKLDYQF